MYVFVFALISVFVCPCCNNTQAAVATPPASAASSDPFDTRVLDPRLVSVYGRGLGCKGWDGIVLRAPAVLCGVSCRAYLSVCLSRVV